MIIKKTLATSSTPAYSAGDAVGSLTTVTNAEIFADPQKWRLNSVLIKDYSRQNFGGLLMILDQMLKDTTVTDNLALNLTYQDEQKMICASSISSSAWYNMSAMSIQVLDMKNTPISTYPGQSLFALLQTISTPTFGGTSHVELCFNFGN